ncbi:STE3-domain-containing protein [Serendipita vermifera]|nr:STE3-domain-containing protein [Serendipita vermifera]
MRQIAHTVACGLSLALLALPAPWHIKARNSGTLIFIFWAFLGNLVFLINNIVWDANIQNPAPIWCDISSKLLIGFNVALPCASLCIQRRLYNITRVNQVAPTAAQKRMDMYIDLAIGIGAPVLMMALHVIVQPYRFNIIEDYGCWPVIYPSVAAYVMILPWPWIVSAISIVYSGLTIRAFLKRRSTFNELLKNQGGGLNVHRYIRLMALASIEVLFVFPMSLLLFIRNLQLSPPLPYRSWSYVHANFDRVVYTTRFMLGLQPDGIVLMELSRWCMPITALMFFVFFGLASEARKQYRIAGHAVLKTFGLRHGSLSSNDNKDTPLTASSRKSRPSFLRKSNTTAVNPTNNNGNGTRNPLSPIEKKRPDTFAWLEEGLPFDDLPYDSTKLPQSPDTAYTRSGHDGRDDGYMPCSPSTSTSHASSNSFDKYGGAFDGDYQSTLGRQASISTARTARTSRTGHSKTSSFAAFARGRGGSVGSYNSANGREDDEETICGVPTSLKRSDSMDKPLPDIPFEDFAKFRRSLREASNENNGDDGDNDRRQSQVSVASSSSRHEQAVVVEEQERPQSQVESSSSSEVEPQVQVFVSSPTNTEFPRTPIVGDSSEQSTPVFVPRTLAPPVASSPLNPANNLSAPSTRPSSMVSQDGAETVFFTPLPGRLSLGPVDLDEYPMPTIQRNNAQ